MNELLAATVTHLKTQLSLDDTNCSEEPEGQPPPFSGELYYAVHQGEWSNRSDLDYDETYGLMVTITKRATFAPVDREYSSVFQSLRTLAAALRTKIHMNYPLINAANVLLTGAVNGFIEPLVFLSADIPQAKGPDWFWAEGDNEPHAGAAITLTFGRARRIQTIESGT